MNIPFRAEPLKPSVDRVGPQPPSRSGIRGSTLRRCGNGAALGPIAGPAFLAADIRGTGTGQLRGFAASQDIFLRRSPAQDDQLGRDSFLPVVFHVPPPIALMASISISKGCPFHSKPFEPLATALCEKKIISSCQQVPQPPQPLGLTDPHGSYPSHALDSLQMKLAKRFISDLKTNLSACVEREYPESG